MKRNYHIAIVPKGYSTQYIVVNRKRVMTTLRNLLDRLDEDTIIAFRVRKRLTKVKEK